MASNNTNSSKINVPEARQALYNMKHEVASSLGINLKQGYNGDISSKDAGSIGGNMVNTILLKHQIKIHRKNIGMMTFSLTLVF